MDPPIFNDTRDATPTFDARSRVRRHQIDKPLAATTVALRRLRSCDPKHRSEVSFFGEEIAERVRVIWSGTEGTRDGKEHDLSLVRHHLEVSFYPFALRGLCALRGSAVPLRPDIVAETNDPRPMCQRVHRASFDARSFGNPQVADILWNHIPSARGTKYLFLQRAHCRARTAGGPPAAATASPARRSRRDALFFFHLTLSRLQQTGDPWTSIPHRSRLCRFPSSTA